jgi:hypothetical protein
MGGLSPPTLFNASFVRGKSMPDAVQDVAQDRLAGAIRFSLFLLPESSRAPDVKRQSRPHNQLLLSDFGAQTLRVL